MHRFQGLVAVALALSSAAQKLKEQYPWYHSTDEIHSELQSLSQNCVGAQLELSSRSAGKHNSADGSGAEINLDVVRVTQGAADGKKKALFVFGEHARELVSPETALEFLRTICGQGNAPNQDLVNRVLNTTTFVLVPNSNPRSRTKVEFGEYCRRTNEDGVDLNRNFGDAHRDNKKAGKDDESNPGPRGFSEPESLIIRDLVSEEKPDIFLSVHSGAYLLGTPFGYTDSRQADNEQNMMDVLKPISEKFCNSECPFGDLSGLIGYQSKGCDIDYVKESLHVPYVFTWEIFTGSDVRGYYAEEAHARAEHRKMSKDADGFFWSKSLSLWQAKSSERLRGRTKAAQPENSEDPKGCFEQFNPKTQEETEAVTQNWAQAFLTLCDEVAMLGLSSRTKAAHTMGNAGAAETTQATSDGSASAAKFMSALDSWNELGSAWLSPSSASKLTGSPLEPS